MRKVVCLLIGICLCLCLSLCLAEGEWTPPEGKTEGEGGSLSAEYLGGTYICGEGGFGMAGARIYEVGHLYDSAYAELATEASVEFLSGDEACREMFAWSESVNPEDGLELSIGTDLDLGGAKSLTGRYRMTAESEHYYVMFEFDAVFIPRSELSVTIDFDRVELPTGQKKIIGTCLNPEEIHTSPEGCYETAGIMTEEGERFIETENYILGNPYVTMLTPGEYPMTLLIEVGVNRYEVLFPVTLVAVEGQQETETPEVSGPETESAGQAVAQQSRPEAENVGRVEAEEPGPGDASDDAGLTLSLDRGDQEFTIYAGSRECHLSFWDIQNYETLAAAWGGAPGWSIMPVEGSADVVRWSNTSVDGKSIWAFYSGDQVAEIGDYTSVLTCTWHGQSASAKITVHVVESPNGLLEGISGLEESYTMTLGETLSVDLQPIPAGWSLPDEREYMRLDSVYSVLEDENTWSDTGNPYFNIKLSDGFGPAAITAWRSGVYRLEISYQCGSFREQLSTSISVLNADGSLPESAGEITEMEGAQWAYDIGVNTSTGENYAIITGGKASKDLVIPAEVDGYPVRMIGSNAFTESNTPGAEEIIETVVIPEGIVILDSYAFRGCNNLKKVTLPESLLLIDYGVFADCRTLTEINLPTAMTKEQIGSEAFRGVGMEDLTLADGTSLLAESLKTGRDTISTYADGWYYQKLEDGTARLAEWADREWNAEEITVPGSVGGIPVSTLGKSLCSYHSNVEKVILPEGLTVIEKDAFRNCTALEEVNLPESLLEVGSCAFTNIAAKGLTLPESARERSSLIWYCSTFRSDSTGSFEYALLEDGTALISRIIAFDAKLEIPAEVDGHPVTGIARISSENTDWQALEQVKSLVLPEGLKFIEEDAFSGFSGLKSVTIPEGVTVIGESAFRSCQALAEIHLPSTLRVIGNEAFSYDPLTSLSLPQSLVSIGNDAFTGHKLQQIEVPAGVRTIGHRAFNPNGNNTPKKVTFLSPLTETGRGLFGYSSGDFYGSSLSTQLYKYNKYLPGYSDDPDSWNDMYTDPGFRSSDVITIACFPGSYVDQIYQYNVKKEYLTWGEENIRTAPADRVLQPGLFEPDELIYELIIPEGVEEIAEGAFSGMRTLSKVTLPSTLTAIGARAFEGCSALSALTVPESVTVIGEAAFSGCTSLKSVNLPAEISEIPVSLFDGCEKLDTLKIKAKVITSVGDYAFRNCGALTKFDFKKGLTEIGQEAFRGSGLKQAQLPDTVEKIGVSAFALSNITSISFPKGMEEIPELVCVGTVYLTNIQLPAAVKSIGDRAFYGAVPSSLKLPEGLISIGVEAFSTLTQDVQSMYVWSNGKKTVTKLKSLKLPASLQVIGQGAFSCNDALTSVTFAKGSQLTEIPDQAFAMCVHLKEITLPDSVQTIGKNAFTNCIDLKKANLGAGVVSIGDETFLYDEAMTELKVPDTATELGSKIIEGHGEKLTVFCTEGSAMDTWLKTNYPEVAVKY